MSRSPRFPRTDNLVPEKTTLNVPDPLPPSCAEAKDNVIRSDRQTTVNLREFRTTKSPKVKKVLKDTGIRAVCPRPRALSMVNYDQKEELDHEQRRYLGTTGRR